MNLYLDYLASKPTVRSLKAILVIPKVIDEFRFDAAMKNRAFNSIYVGDDLFCRFHTHQLYYQSNIISILLSLNDLKCNSCKYFNKCLTPFNLFLANRDMYPYSYSKGEAALMLSFLYPKIIKYGYSLRAFKKKDRFFEAEILTFFNFLVQKLNLSTSLLVKSEKLVDYFYPEVSASFPSSFEQAKIESEWKKLLNENKNISISLNEYKIFKINPELIYFNCVVCGTSNFNHLSPYCSDSCRASDDLSFYYKASMMYDVKLYPYIEGLFYRPYILVNNQVYDRTVKYAEIIKRLGYGFSLIK